MKVVTSILAALMCLSTSMDTDNNPKTQAKMAAGWIEIDFAPLQLMVNPPDGYTVSLVITAKDGQKIGGPFTTSGAASPEAMRLAVRVCLTDGGWIAENGKKDTTLLVKGTKAGSLVKDWTITVEGIPKEHTPKVRRLMAQAKQK